MAENPWDVFSRPPAPATDESVFAGKPPAPAPYGPTQTPYEAAKARWRMTVGDRLTPAREQGYDDAQKRGPVQAGLTGFLSGTTGNLTDYPYAVAAGIEGAVTGKGFSEPYNASLERDRGEAEGLAEKYPGTTIGSEITGAVAGSIGPSKFIKGATTLARMLKAALVGGGVGGFQGAAGGEGVEGRATGAAKGVGLGAVFGGVGEGVVSGIGAGARKAFGAANKPAPGVDPAARVAEAAEFKIPLTRGTATGNIDQQAYEEAARHAARGRIPGQVMRNFDEVQAKAIGAAKEGVSTKLGGAPRSLEEGGEAVGAGLKGAAQTARTEAGKLYDAAAGKHAWISADDVTRLGQSVGDELERGGIRLDQYGNYPGAQAAMNLLRRVAGFEKPPPGSVIGAETPVAQSLAGIEQARKALIKVQGANGEDARALNAIRKSFDKWLDDAVDKRLFSGDPSAIDDLKGARALWSRYKGLTEGEGGDASKLISKIINEQRTGQEVAAWLLGTAGPHSAGLSARAASEIRGILGAGSPEWEALRQAAWTKVMNPTRGQGGPQALASSIDDMVKGHGSPLAKVLFSEEERAMMGRLAKVVRNTVVDPRATNPSKSSYGVARAIGATGMIGGGGAAAYWLDPNYAAIAAAPILKGASGAARARAATRAAPSSLAGRIGEASRAGVTTGAGEARSLPLPGLTGARRAGAEDDDAQK